MRRSTREFLSWIRDRPHREEILWHSVALSADEPWAGGWVDIGVAAFRSSSVGGCGLTFVPPHHRSALFTPGNYALPRDLDVHAVYDPNPPHRWFVADIAVPKGERPTESQEAELTAALNERPGRTRGVRGGWSIGTLTRGIAEWTARHTGRHDLHWTWNSSWRLPPGLETLLSAIGDGIEPTFQLDRRVGASEQAFDTLVNLITRDTLPIRPASARSPGQPFDPYDL